MALSCDSRGRLVFHNVTGYLSITNFLAGEAEHTHAKQTHGSQSV